MDKHHCKFKCIVNRTFACIVCNALHHCGPGKCEHLFYNVDQTRVCSMTGLCFSQKQGDKFDSVRDQADPVYHPRVKRDQQVNNRELNTEYASGVVDAMRAVVPLSQSQRDALVHKIVTLWKEYVKIEKLRNEYTQRKNKRCFVVAIVMALKKGMCNDTNQFIVHPHPDLPVKSLNKKRNYQKFNVTDIRDGQNLIKKRFKGVKVSDHLCISLENVEESATVAKIEFQQVEPYKKRRFECI